MPVGRGELAKSHRGHGQAFPHPPILEFLYIGSPNKHSTTMILPETLRAPHLLHIGLEKLCIFYPVIMLNNYPTPHVILPNLRSFAFQGVSAY
jgi:hypothetical protein